MSKDDSSHLLQEVPDALAGRQLEAQALEEGQHVLFRPMEDDVALRHEQDVVEKLIHLRRWLQQRHKHCALQQRWQHLHHAGISDRVACWETALGR